MELGFMRYKPAKIKLGKSKHDQIVSDKNTCFTREEQAIQKEFIKDVVNGLSQFQKTLPCKYFYDETGSRLFEKICTLDEYYITRAELALIDEIKFELSSIIGPGAVIIEPGAGAGIKIKKLLSVLDSPASYVPIEISTNILYDNARKIQQNYPEMEVMPIQGDFCRPFKWPGKSSRTNRVMFFPGSTIGNFTPRQAEKFLANQAELLGKDGAIIIGIDLVKSKERIEAAYNDKQGVTADFNKNILVRINAELGSNFNLDHFQHSAIFNQQESRIEMHLKSTIKQSVLINRQRFDFAINESIHTENSYKYTLRDFTEISSNAGWDNKKYWVDNNNLISIHYLVQQ